MYEIFEHTADIGFRVRAEDLASVLVDAGEALFSLIVPNLTDVRPLQSRDLALTADDPEHLLVDWLSELLYLFESEHLVFSRFDVRRWGLVVDATLWGEPLDPARHRLGHEIKAITYHGLSVEQVDGHWEASVIVDV